MTLLYTFQDASQLFFVMSYARNGELLQYINKLGSLSLECAQFYSAELLIAIEEMHRKKIIHRDLKPENLLLDRNMHLMVDYCKINSCLEIASSKEIFSGC